MIRLGYLALVVATAGCFDSLVTDACQPGFTRAGDRCVAGDNTSVDGGTGGSGGGSGGGGGSGLPHGSVNPGSETCVAPDVRCDGDCVDLQIDPDNCGSCGHVCASGLCDAGVCLGDLPGHVVAIGHDYEKSHAAQERMLANAVGLGPHHDVSVAWWRGTATTASHQGTVAALGSAMPKTGRTWHSVALSETPGFNGIDTLVIEAQTGDGDAAQAAGLPWASAVATFLARGGVVIVLEGRGGVSYRLAEGIGLFTVTGVTDATLQQALVVDPSDAVLAQVVSPYLAETTSVVFTGVTSPIVTTRSGGTVVFHQTR
jgi:hypothetical protein